eukprot:scaffold1890_cov96-Cylindrotheca_fusiformis.AAC.3
MRKGNLLLSSLVLSSLVLWIGSHESTSSIEHENREDSCVCNTFLLVGRVAQIDAVKQQLHAGHSLIAPRILPFGFFPQFVRISSSCGQDNNCGHQHTNKLDP